MGIFKKYRKLIISFIAVFLYFFSFFASHFLIGNIVGSFAVIPIVVISWFYVVVIAWFYGATAGLLSGIILTLCNLLLLAFISNDMPGVFLQSFVGGILAVVAGYIVGYAKDSSKKADVLQKQYRALASGIEKAKDIIYITNTEGIITYANPAFTTIYGYTRADWEGKTPRILKSGEKDEDFYKNLWTHLKTGKSLNFKIHNKTKSGKLIPIDSTVSPLFNESGDLYGFLAIQREIEKEEILESELKSQQKQLDLIIGSMGEGLLMIGEDYKIEMINLKAQYLLGVEEEEAVGKKWSDIAKAYKGNEEIPFNERTSIQVLKTGASLVTQLDDDHYYVTPHGKKFPVTSVTTPIIKDNKVKGVVKVFKDASIEKEAKRIIEQTIKEKSTELKRQQNISSSILENTGEGVVLSNSKGIIEFINPAFVSLVGGKEKDYVGRDFSEIFTAYDLNDKEIKAEEISDAAAVTAKNHEMKIQIDTHDKQKVAILINASPVYVEDEYIGIVRVVHDITDEVRLAQQKDDFFSIASHELRTPMTVISGNLDTLLNYSESNFTPTDKETIQDTISSSDRLIKLVNDYLNVSRLDQGRLKYEKKELNACAIIGSVVDELKPLAGEKGLQLINECNGENYNVIADEGLLKQILINLIGNSTKFTEQGSITAKHELVGDKLKISITDTGVGIPKNFQDKLFGRFQQGSNRTITRIAGGTGLGLYISREFARVLGGDLVLEKSEVGKGTTFSLTLPLAKK